jgi:Uncharacterised protein family (UPF0175)
MVLTVEIPDEIANRLIAEGRDLSRDALEALLADEYRNDRISKSELMQLLNIPTSYELDGFLKAHDVWIECTLEELNEEVKGLERLGL